MRIFVWLIRAFIFFTLFAFALNNQDGATVHWFFGVSWHGPMVFIVFVAFVAGCAVGLLAMVPTWWQQRRTIARLTPAPVAPPPAPPPSSMLPSEFGPEHPPREGL